ncbi:MAG: MraY family glycosyltransferase, partial [Planctomycetota bacterium]
MLSFALLCFVPACLVSCFGTGLMRRLAPRWGLMDQPAARKVHLIPTPLGGGIGIWLGVVAPLVGGLLVAWSIPYFPALKEWLPAEIWPHLDGIRFRSGKLWAILAGGTVLSVMGLFDDWKSLPWQPRLLVQFLVACGLVFGAGIHATVFVNVPGVGAALSVLWILVLINSFNFLDNMDGLSAGIGLIAASLFGLIMLTATSEPRWLVGGTLLILAGSLLGFLFHNRPPAKIFMGDTGSYFIGLMLACLTVQGTFFEYGRNGTHVILAPLCILAVPLYDICSVLLIRVWQGRSPFQPDKSHFSHRLVEMGLSKPAAVATIHLTTLMTGLAGLLLYQVSGW